MNIIKENIGYSKLSQEARYRKLLESTQKESDRNKEKICYTSMISITLVDLQVSEDIGGQKDILISGI